ncbi:type I polyketide synthase [Nonomuraea sp. NPDC048916]|uniref:type I polyketide synthase n=1 Tax=Nonomuraea sp. NPDC048916 TaxID=3154232 RepID=UPI003403668D
MTDPAAAWPPAGAEPVDIGDLYRRLDDRGLRYGPVFRGLRAAWRDGDDILAEVSLDADAPGMPGFHLHPALLDSALHAALIPHLEKGDSTPLPFTWRNVRVRTPGARTARVRITPSGDSALSIQVLDGDGRPVASIGSLALRPLTNELGAAHHARLLRLTWRAVTTPEATPSAGQWALLGTDHLGLTGALKAAGRPIEIHQSLHTFDAELRRGRRVPDVVAVSCTLPGADEGDEAAGVRRALQRALILVQEWLADERLADCLLVLVTQGAVAARPGEDVADLSGAALWGLVRSAQTEHPGRFVLVDLDDAQSSGRALVSAVASSEPQVAVRDSLLFRPRLSRCPPVTARQGTAVRWNPRGTILVTGGTGALGRVVARHLVRRHAVRHLLLLSRSGSAAPGAAELVSELGELGADIQVVACDAADRLALARVIGEIPDDRPLTAVIHAAGMVQDGTIAMLTPHRLERVLRAKIDSALNLHEVTRDRDACDFALFSSASGVVGGSGQANYAAANAFLDGLAHRRKVLGLPAVSLAWGPWEGDGMMDAVSATDVARMRRSGLALITEAQGLALLDAARGRDEAVLVPVRLDEEALQANGAGLHALLADLAHPSPAQQGGGVGGGGGGAAGDLRELLRLVPAAERAATVAEFVRAQVAIVLGHASAEAVMPDRDFVAAGFDSLSTLELKRRLATATGLRLPATLAFDHPTPIQLATYLHQLLMAEPDPHEVSG